MRLYIVNQEHYVVADSLPEAEVLYERETEIAVDSISFVSPNILIQENNHDNK